MNADSPMLTIYMIKDCDRWVQIRSDDPVVGAQLTRLLQLSHDHRPVLQRRVHVGDRLTYRTKKDDSPWEVCKIVPSDWVVTSVVNYEPSDLAELPEFGSIAIAYCERSPLSPEWVEVLTAEVITKVSVESFGGDEAAYQEFLGSGAGRRYVQLSKEA